MTDTMHDAHQARAARRAAEDVDRLAAVDRAEALEDERVRALPVADADVDADPEVVTLEQAIADGQDVTAEELGQVRAAAATRSRFARLLGARDERKARRDAEELERNQAAAADKAARKALAPYDGPALVEAYDAAVAAVRAYTDALGARNQALARLATLPAEERSRGAVQGSAFPISAELTLDGRLIRRQDIAHHVERVLRAAHLVRVRDRYLPAEDTAYTPDDRDPQIIAEARAA